MCYTIKRGCSKMNHVCSSAIMKGQLEWLIGDTVVLPLYNEKSISECCLNVFKLKSRLKDQARITLQSNIKLVLYHSNQFETASTSFRLSRSRISITLFSHIYTSHHVKIPWSPSSRSAPKVNGVCSIRLRPFPQLGFVEISIFCAADKPTQFKTIHPWQR